MSDEQKKSVKKDIQPDTIDSKKKKKKKKIDSDTLAIFAILAVIVIIAVLSVFLNYGSGSPELSGKIGNKYQQREGKSSLMVLVTCASVSVFVIVLFVIKKIRDGKRKAKLKAEQMEKARRMKQIENARERVRMAKLDEFLAAGQSEVEKRRRDEALLKNSRGGRYPSELQGARENGEYIKRDLNAYRDDMPEIDEDFEKEENFLKRIFRRIKELFSGKNHEN